jgi:predicted nucleotidyltransferase
MDIQGVQLSDHHQNILNRFVTACQTDERIVAAILVGSYVNGKPDEHSDLDLYLISTDEAYDDFASTRESFIRLLGEPLFVEDFDIPGIVFLIFADGSEVEIQYARASQLNRIFNAPYKILLDKKNIAVNIVSGEVHEFNQEEQTKKLRRLVYGFWHDFSHFVTAMSRNQLWWAHGQLDALRSICVNLARLRNKFSDPDIGEEPYFKIEKAMPVAQLAPLQDTFCPMEKKAMLESAFVILNFYREFAIALAQKHAISYPAALEQVMVEKLNKVANKI